MIPHGLRQCGTKDLKRGEDLRAGREAETTAARELSRSPWGKWHLSEAKALSVSE